VRWAGGTGPFATLAGYDVRAEVLKSKRGAPGKSALVQCTTFETRGPDMTAMRDRALAREPHIHAGTGRY
jgi:hypothetical protein